jgi:hypothetical protein
MKVSYTESTQHKTTGECTVYSNVQNISHKAMLWQHLKCEEAGKTSEI